MPQNAPHHAQHTNQQLHQQPNSDVGGLRVFEQLLPVFYTQQRLRDHDAAIDPTLSADALAGGISDVAVILPHRGRHYHPNEDQPSRDERMRGGHFENVLQKERVQFRHLPKQNQLTQSEDPHVRTLRVQPPDRRPTLGGELQNDPLDFARSGVDVPDADPLVLAHLEYVADFQSAPDAETVADEHVEYEGVPPALHEIGEQMRERHLRDLPHHADRPQDAHVSDQDGFEHPPEEVAQSEHVHMPPDALQRDVRTVHPVLLVHVDVEIGQARVEPYEDVPDRPVVLKEKKEECEEVEDAQSEDYAPDGGMGANEGAVRKRQHRYDQEEEDAAEHARPDVVLHIFRVSENKREMKS